MSLQVNNYRLKFYNEELFTAKRSLFNAKSVRNLKAIQQRIKYLDEQVKLIESGKGGFSI